MQTTSSPSIASRDGGDTVLTPVLRRPPDAGQGPEIMAPPPDPPDSPETADWLATCPAPLRRRFEDPSLLHPREKDLFCSIAAGLVAELKPKTPEVWQAIARVGADEADMESLRRARADVLAHHRHAVLGEALRDNGHGGQVDQALALAAATGNAAALQAVLARLSGRVALASLEHKAMMAAAADLETIDIQLQRTHRRLLENRRLLAQAGAIDVRPVLAPAGAS